MKVFDFNIGEYAFTYVKWKLLAYLQIATKHAILW